MAADILVLSARRMCRWARTRSSIWNWRATSPQKFNTDFAAELFTLPDPIIPKAAARIMSLRDGTNKMSKSDPSDMSRINLTDDADTIADKIRRARTDPHPLPASKAELKDRPEAENLLNIYAALAEQDRDAVIAQFAGQQFSRFKSALAELTVAKLGPITSEMRRLLADPGEIDRILKAGAQKARAIATPIMDEVKKRVGFVG
jgi:tryptophanyl-tRNA synthetase